jgi:hypothetical protein
MVIDRLKLYSTTYITMFIMRALVDYFYPYAEWQGPLGSIRFDMFFILICIVIVISLSIVMGAVDYYDANTKDV